METKVPISTIDQKISILVCGNCQKHIASSLHNFCPYCGTRIDWQPEQKEQCETNNIAWYKASLESLSQTLDPVVPAF